MFQMTGSLLGMTSATRSPALSHPGCVSSSVFALELLKEIRHETAPAALLGLRQLFLVLWERGYYGRPSQIFSAGAQWKTNAAARRACQSWSVTGKNHHHQQHTEIHGAVNIYCVPHRVYGSGIVHKNKCSGTRGSLCGFPRGQS